MDKPSDMKDLLTEGGTSETDLGHRQDRRRLAFPTRFRPGSAPSHQASELVREEEIGAAGQRHVHLYKIGSARRMLGRVSNQNSATLPWREFSKRSDADAAIATFLERGQRFLKGELNADQVNEFS